MMLIDNRNYLRIHQRALLEKLSQFEMKNLGDRLIVEPSKKGMPTAKVMVDNKIQYIHSKYDPETESKKLISQLEDNDKYDHVLFIGTGLGYHIKEFLNKWPDISFSIFEHDLEILYQFLSYQNLSDFPKAKLEKIIASKDENEIRTELQSLYGKNGIKIFVYTLPFYVNHYKREEEIIMETLRESIKNKHSNLAAEFSFQKRWTINSIKNFPKVLQTPNILHDIDKNNFKGKPAIIVAAGPSLNEEFHNLKYIKENGLAYIFSVGSAINALIEHEIFPDAACTYDPTEKNQFVFEKLKERNITDIPLIFGSSVGFETLDNYPGKMFHMLTNQDTIAPYFIKNPEDINIVLDAPSIAVVTFQLLKMLGSSQIFLVGQNLGFQNNSRYAAGIKYDWVKSDISEHEKQHLLTVKDVYGKDIQTSVAYNRILKQFEMYIKLFSDIEVINTTKGGADIKGTVFMSLSEVITQKLIKTNIVNSNWSEAEKSYDIAYPKQQIIKMQYARDDLEQILNNVIKELRDINKAVSLIQTKELEKKFIRFDKEFNKLRSNPFFKAFIEPMVRVHNKRLAEESQFVRFEKDLIKKGRAVAHLFAGFFIDCQAHLKFLSPYLKELEEQINKLNNKTRENIKSNRGY